MLNTLYSLQKKHLEWSCKCFSRHLWLKIGKLDCTSSPTKRSLELTDLVVVGHLHKSAYQFCPHLLFDYIRTGGAPLTKHHWFLTYFCAQHAMSTITWTGPATNRWCHGTVRDPLYPHPQKPQGNWDPNPPMIEPKAKPRKVKWRTMFWNMVFTCLQYTSPEPRKTRGPLLSMSHPGC